MPTYEDLKNFFDESAEFKDFAREAAANPIVRGITLDVNPFWAATVDFEENLITEFEFRRVTEFWYPWPLWESTHWREPRYQGWRRRDLYRKSERWEKSAKEYSKRMGLGGKPVVLTAVFTMPTPVIQEGGSEAGPTHLGRLQQLAAGRDGVRLEQRAGARFSLGIGDGIITGAGKVGTVGGILRDASGNAWGMTCQHVAAKTDNVFSKSGGFLGACVQDTPRTPLPAGLSCDPTHLAWSGNTDIANTLDLALLKLVSVPTTEALGGTASSLTPGQNVEVLGAVSQISAKLGSLAIAYKFRDQDHDYCFRDCIEVLPTPKIPLGGWLGNLFASPPKPGDSGAWVLTKDPTPIWAGVFFADDGSRGFAIRASWAHNWAEEAVGAELSVSLPV